MNRRAHRFHSCTFVPFVHPLLGLPRRGIPFADPSRSNYIVGTMPRARASTVKARIVAIGNSQGIRIPKPLLEQAGLTGDVELRAEAGQIVIATARRPRAGWAAAAADLHARGDDGLLETPTPAFDGEWEWR